MIDINVSSVILRPFAPEDAVDLYRGLSDPHVNQYFSGNFSTEVSGQASMDWFADLENSGTGKWLAISSAGDKRLLGAGGIHNIRKQHNKAEIGFWLLPEHWGKGIMKQAVPIICKYAFTERMIHRLEAIVEAGNERSALLLPKCGFLREGTMRECEIKNGSFITLHLFSKLATDRS